MSRLTEIHQQLETEIGQFGEVHNRYQQLQMIGSQLASPEVAPTVMKQVKMGLVFPDPVGLVEMATTGGEGVASTTVTNAANEIVRSYPAIFQRIADLAAEAVQHCNAAIAAADQQAQPPQPPSTPPVAQLQTTAPPAPQQLATTPVTPVQQ